jgi:hypothetical protein
MKTQHGRDLTGEEMAQMLEEFANGAGSTGIETFVEHLTCRTHRTLQQKVMGMFVKTIEAWAEAKGGLDLRNAATVTLARKIVAATGDTYDRFLPTI